MRSLIRRSYSPIKQNHGAYLNLRYTELQALKDAQKTPAPKYIHAHFVGYGIHQLFDYEVAPTYITMLRHPVERLRSILTYGQTGGFENLDHALSNFLSNPQPDLTELQKNILERARFDNMMTRTLGSLDCTAIPRDASICSEDIFHVAMDRILNHIDLVMITERFDESVLILQNTLGLRNPWYRRINSSRSSTLQSSAKLGHGRPQPSVLHDLENYVLSRDQLDCRLYKAALQRFESRIDQEFNDINQDLAQYRRSNRLFGSCYKVWDKFMPRKIFYKN
jgi:hypothetical protein